jgi:co-chaperonin GroES (HSP10)
MKNRFPILLLYSIIATFSILVAGGKHSAGYEIIRPILNIIEIPSEGIVIAVGSNVYWRKKASRLRKVLVNDVIDIGDSILVKQYSFIKLKFDSESIMIGPVKMTSWYMMEKKSEKL